MKFEWNPEKAQTSLSKHGVTFQEAATVFLDSNALRLSDPQHSTPTEIREYRIGVSILSRVLLVVYTERSDHDEIEIVRIISARKASPKEKKAYHGEI